MKTVCAIVLVIGLTGCQASKTKDQNKPTATKKEKSAAEEAYDAGARARKKAESLKAEQERKLKEATDAGNQ